MTASELKNYLTEHLVPSKLYQIGGEESGRICLEKVNGLWEVFFCEGKKKIGTLFFKDETSACAHMLKEITKVVELLSDGPRALA
ncbi:MAG: hypothetical protein IJU80_09320 [Lachnospiraceae bacterium]|nr:hypothetical protein [Lachnospiraceae bacterium]